MLARLARIARVEASEMGLVRPLFLQHLLLVAAITLAKTARDSLFLSDLPAQYLPYVFFGLAIWTALATWIFGRVFSSVPTHVVLARTNLFVGILLVAFSLWFWVTPAAPAVTFYIWLGAYGILLVAELWILIGERINPRQARRLFTVIATGGILGGILGGLVAAALGGLLPAQWLLLLAAALHLAIVPLALESGRRREEAPPEAKGRRRPEQAGMRRALRQPFVRTLVLIFLLAGITSTVLEYQFKLLIQDRITDPGEMTTFFGAFYWLQSVLALVLQLTATTWILYRFGARVARTTLPAGILAGSAVALVVPAFLPIVLTRLYDTTLRISVFRTAAEILFFPLTDAMRRQAKRIVDAVVSRAAEAISGGLILLINFLLGGSLLQFSLLLCLLAVLWLGLSRAVYGVYVQELSRSLRSLLLGPEAHPVSLREAGVINELYSLLDSDLEIRVLHGLDLLARLDPERFRRALPPLFQHPSAKVRARALELTSEDPSGLSLAEVERLLSDRNDDVRMNASFVYCQIAPGDPTGNIINLTNSDNALVRSGALQCIASHSPAEDDGKVDEVAAGFLQRGTPTDRLAVARAIGRRPAPTVLERHLFTLLWDPDLAVRRAALVSSGRVMSRELVPTLIERLALPDETGAAREGLVHLGERVVGTLTDHLLDPAVPGTIRREIPAIFSRIGSRSAVSGLVRAAASQERVVSYRALKALNKLREQLGSLPFPEGEITRQMVADADLFQELLRCRSALAESAAGDWQRLLLRVLRERAEQTMERLFRKMGLLYPSREAYVAHQGITSSNVRLRTQSIEYLETILAPEHRRILLPVTESFDRASWEPPPTPVAPKAAGDLAATLSLLADRADPWLTSVVLFAIGRMKLASLADLVGEALKSRDPIVKDTATWAEARLAAN